VELDGAVDSHRSRRATRPDADADSVHGRIDHRGTFHDGVRQEALTLRREDILALDKAHVWHPYTAMRVYLDEVSPLVIARADGSRLYDADGRAYLDGNASWWTATLGHRHPRIVDALRRQLETLDHCALAGITHEHAAALASELAAIAPGRALSHVFYTDDGSTAIEAAVKMAIQHWSLRGAVKKTRFVALDAAFHGESIGATSLGGVDAFRRPFARVLFDCVHVPWGAMHGLLEREHDTIAAVVVEPMLQGAAGMRTYPASHLHELRDLCDRTGVLLVFDEVFTGYGRTGPMWAAEHAGVAPDLMCLGKAFAQVMPMGATLVSDRVFETFVEDRTTAFFYGHSFCGNPLGAAVAREVLAVYRDEDVLGQVAVKSPRLARAFDRVARIEGVRAVRHIGMAGAADLGDLTSASESLEEAGYLGTLGWRVYAEGLKRGAYLRPLGDTVYLCPPLTITDRDLDELLAIFEESITASLHHD
jgi:adenosylmethionine-8-amino-7-oxononanoate aminotransferase